MSLFIAGRVISDRWGQNGLVFDTEYPDQSTLTPLIFENNLFARADDMNALLVNTNFAALQSREDWVRSDYDDVRIIATTPTRVIVEFTFQRVKSDGDVYMRIPALWVLAYEDGRWGLKFRSLMASTVD